MKRQPDLDLRVCKRQVTDMWTAEHHPLHTAARNKAERESEGEKQKKINNRGGGGAWGGGWGGGERERIRSMYTNSTCKHEEDKQNETHT